MAAFPSSIVILSVLHYYEKYDVVPHLNHKPVLPMVIRPFFSSLQLHAIKWS